MKSKISVTLPREVLRQLDLETGKNGNRSAIVAEAVLEYLDRRKASDRDQRDLNLINQAAEQLNEHARDVLEYQDPQ